ncbi:MAG: iron-containing alcohol dehydrogenase [Clostridiales bacterium]|nr:iron-containing alcohol dehydrogenase [Clostridiales bacterium]
MKALIFNSGVGKRMGELTRNTHKSLAVLNDGETILERQIRILSECGIREFVITTGPHEEKLKAVTAQYPQLTFRFVRNELYDKTNYIYSFYLTKEYLDDDFLLLHGDLVFNKRLVTDLLNHSAPSVGLINKSIKKPEKDFKARVINGCIKEVGINIFDADCFAFQPLYKLCRKDINAWWERVSDFIAQGTNGCYAENALNEITEKVMIKAMRYDDYFIDEIDCPEDYARVTACIRIFDFDEQETAYSLDFLKALNNPLVVVDSFLKDGFSTYKTFCDFKPNPVYEDVMKGVKAFEGCDSIVSVGGGSAIDVAKAIKYFLCLDADGNFVYKNIKHYSVPTTAGTGSESTRYAVIYKDGVKQTLTHDALFPDVAVLVPQLLESLPPYQKKCTLLDALCHAIESIWSVNATEDSRQYAREAIELIKSNYKAYVSGEASVIPKMLKAANLAGRAINISQTTAAHAMSYKLTSLYKIPHGHAVALTLPYLWQLLIEADCQSLQYENITVTEFNEIYNDLGLDSALDISEEQMDILVSSVNLLRLGNFPLKLSKDDIRGLYMRIRKHVR